MRAGGRSLLRRLLVLRLSIDSHWRGKVMTKADLVEEIAAKTGVSKNHTALIVDDLLSAISKALSDGHHLEIRGFGTFKVRERRARRARNPRSGEEVLVPAKLVPVFKPSKELKALIADTGTETADVQQQSTVE
jgi:nucleoid DNA-binding protein